MNLGAITYGNASYVEGCSFQDGFNAGIGVYGTHNLTLKQNVIHHTVGPGVDLEGSSNELVDNLVMMSLAEETFKVRLFLLLSRLKTTFQEVRGLRQ